MSDVPQLILTGGPVLTMDPAAPEAEALAVRDGVITAVGAARDVLPLRGARTEVVDLTGQALLPGFVEAHGHPTIMGLAVAPPALDVRPFSVPTGRAVYERIRAAVAAAPGEPVAAYGIDLLLQRDLALPTRELLDSLSPHAPLVVISNSGHAWSTAAPSRRTSTAVPPNSARVSLFMDHVRWWGDVLADDLFGPEVAGRWMAVRSAWDAGHRVSLHNDGICSPTDPLSGVATAMTRRTPAAGCTGPPSASRSWRPCAPSPSIPHGNCTWRTRSACCAPACAPTSSSRPATRAPYPSNAFREEVRVTATYLGGRPTRS